jgi:hypothetical protein
VRTRARVEWRGPLLGLHPGSALGHQPSVSSAGCVSKDKVHGRVQGPSVSKGTLHTIGQVDLL